MRRLPGVFIINAIVRSYAWLLFRIGWSELYSRWRALLLTLSRLPTKTHEPARSSLSDERNYASFTVMMFIRAISTIRAATVDFGDDSFSIHILLDQAYYRSIHIPNVICRIFAYRCYICIIVSEIECKPILNFLLQRRRVGYAHELHNLQNWPSILKFKRRCVRKQSRYVTSRSSINTYTNVIKVIS